MDEITLDLIDRLYREKYDFLFKYAKYVFGNRSIAEEAVHETFIVACIYHEKLQASLNPEGWIVNTHKFVCRNIQKSRKREIQKMLLLTNENVLKPCGYTEPAFESQINFEDYVSSDDFVILRKFIIEGYSHKDLAKELNITIDACKKRLQRAKEKFRKNFHPQ